MNDDELREQLALAAVGALTAPERAELDDALRTRPDLRAELEDLEHVAASLFDDVAPPPALRARVLDLVADTPQLPPDARRDASAPSSVAEPTSAHDPDAGQTPGPPDAPMASVVPIGAGRRRTRSLLLATAAAAALIAVGGVVVVAPWESDGDDPVAAVVGSDDAVEIPMAGELAGLRIVHSPGEDAAVLLADGVPVPPDDRVYELWAIRDGEPVPAGTFRPEPDGTLAVYLDDLDPASAEQWAITEEPAGGSESPTSPVLAAT